MFAAAFVTRLDEAQAQDQCGTVDSIAYPIDTNAFQLGQDFGTASPRHQGRFHTGEDWFAGYGATRGQPVRAIADGLVTFSGPNAWGVDGGVVILRHTLPDGDFIFSQYGHIEQSDSVAFPPRLSCVEAGQIIGVIADARPSPHLHFEVRVLTEDNPTIADNPGPGYTRENPLDIGWRRPMKTLTNLQAQLSRAYLWHGDLTSSERFAPPLVLNDNSVFLIDGDRLRRLTWDGRQFWRTTIDQNAISVHGFQAQSFVTFADGTVTRVDLDDGSLDESWQLSIEPDMPPLLVGDRPVYHTRANTLAMVSEDQREVLWQASGVPRYTRSAVSDRLIGVATADRILVFDHNGTQLDAANLTDGAALAAHADGSLIAYTQGGLWKIDPNGQWSILLDNAPPGGQNTAVTVLPDGQIFVTDGQQVTAYDAAGIAAWQAQLPRTVTGDLTINVVADSLLITGSGGEIVAVRTVGGICGFTNIYGTGRTPMWSQLGDDGTLRISLGDQIIGFDWERFAPGC